MYLCNEVKTEKYMKHIDVGYHRIKSLIDDCVLSVQYVDSVNQKADLLTKLFCLFKLNTLLLLYFVVRLLFYNSM